jgi:hypothetical protein
VSNGRDSRRDNLAVYEDNSAHCFACGYHKHSPGFRKVIKVSNELKAVRPGDFSKEVPNHAWKWLLQYGLPWSYWEAHCGYSENDERLIFSIGRPNVTFSIGRWTPKFPDEEPTEKRKWFIYGNNRNHCEIVGNPGECIVLVEDIVSAHKVGQVIQCVPLFGTGINDAVIYWLMTQHKPVKLWLDNDQSGHVYRKAVTLQGLIGSQVSVIISDRDPKCYPVNDILGML